MKDIKITIDITIEGLDEMIEKSEDKNENLIVSKYAVKWNEDSKWFRYSDTCNRLMLKTVKDYMTTILKQRGYVYLYEVLTELDIPVHQKYLSVGWVYDEKNPIGDNEIIITVLDDPEEDGYILDFNVDGDVLSILKKKGKLK